MSVEGIIDHIIAEADSEAKKIINDAQNEAGIIKEKSKSEADEYFEKQMHLIDEKYRREKERMTLNKRLDQRKNMLQARQKWMDEAFSNGYKILIDQPLSEYKKLLISLIENVSQSRDEEVIFGKKGTKKFLDEVIKELNGKKGMKFSLSDERGDFPWGFILRKGKVEINMSIDSLFKYKRTDLEQKAWEIFNANV